jgi:hypothetical protein
MLREVGALDCGALLRSRRAHNVIPAQAGIQVRGASQTSSAGRTFSMDSGLRRNDPVKKNSRGGFRRPHREPVQKTKNPKNRVGKAERFG